jgi:hypothetical protein
VLEPTSFKPKHGKMVSAMISKYATLHQRDREIANFGVFRRSLFDYDVEKVAIAHVRENQPSLDRPRPREIRG